MKITIKVVVLTILLIASLSPSLAIDGQSADFNVGNNQVSDGLATGVTTGDYSIITLTNLNPSNAADFNPGSGGKIKIPKIISVVFYLPNELCKVGTYDLDLLTAGQVSSSNNSTASACDNDGTSQESTLQLPSNDKVFANVSCSLSKTTKKVIKSKGIAATGTTKIGKFTIDSIEENGITKRIIGSYNIGLETKKFKSKVPIINDIQNVDCKKILKKTKTKVGKKAKNIDSMGTFDANILVGQQPSNPSSGGDSSSGDPPTIPGLPDGFDPSDFF